MTQHQDPENIFINGEVASVAELEYMEGLALELLTEFEGDVHRQYGYATETDCAVLFTTHAHEEVAALGSVASILIAKDDYENPLLTVSYGYDNIPCLFLFKDNNELSEVPGIIQELLESNIQHLDAQVLRHVQSIVFCILSGVDIKELNVGIMPGDELKDDYKYVADVIRQQVVENTKCEVRSKDWGIDYEDGSTLAIVSNEVSGTNYTYEEIAELPVLLIELVDKASQTTYTYTKAQNGDTSLESSITKPDNSYIVEDEEVEDEIALFVEDLQLDTPGKNDVLQITYSLSRAILIDT